MKKSFLLTLAALGLSLTAGLQAQDAPNAPRPGPGGNPAEQPNNFHRNLFEPEMIMGCQAELKLSDEQSQAIKTILSTNKATVTGLEWDMNQATTALSKSLSGTQIDETAALQLLDKLMEIERNIKRNHLQMAIQLKNKLTPEQQEILSRKREEKLMKSMMLQGRPGFEGPMPPRGGRGNFEGGPMRRPGPGAEGPMPPQGDRPGDGPLPPPVKPDDQKLLPPQ